MVYKELTHDQLLLENEELKSRLNEAEEALSAIRNGEVDAIIVSGTGGDKVFSLTSAETPYRLLLEEMDEGALNIGADGTILYCNKRFARLISLPAEKIIGINCREFVAAGDIARFDELIKSGLKGYSNDIISFSKNGSLSIIHLKLSVKALPKGMAGDLSVVASDVSNLKKQQEKLEILVNKRTSEIQRSNEILQKKIIEIKESKEALRESENKYSSVYSSMSEGIAIHELIFDDSGKAADYLITDVNPAYEQIIGVKKKNVVGLKASEVYKVSSAPYLDIYSNVALSGDSQTFETYFPPMDKHFHVSVFSPGKGKFATVFQDISERKHSEEKLRLTLNRFYLVLSKMRNGILLLTNENRVEFVNQPFCEIFDLKKNPEELLNLTADKVISLIRDKYLEPDKEIGRIKEIVEKQIPVSGEDITMKSGRTYIRDFTPIYINENNYGRLWSHVDITDRKESENILSNTLQRFYLMLSGMFTGVLLMTDEGKVELVNQAFCNYYYLKESPIDLIGISSAELLRKIKPGFNDPDLALIRIREILSKGEFVRNEEFAMRNGETALRDFVPLKVNGVSVGRFWIHFDITERKKAETALRISEERLRVTLTSIGDAVMTFDTACRVVFLNPVAVKLTGWEPEDAAGQPVENIFRLINELTQVPVENIVAKVLQEGKVVGLSNHTSLISKNGNKIPIEDSAAPIKDPFGNVIGVILVFHDVTEKRQAHEALKESEERFRNLVKNAPAAIYEMDFTTRKFINVNDSMCILSGYTRDELLSIDSLELLDNESKNLFLSRISKNLKGEKTEENVEYRVKAKDGRMIDAILNMKFNFNEKGIPTGAIVVGHDITQRKQAERKLIEAGEALKESEKRFRNLAENTPDMILRFDKDLTLLYGNEAVLIRTGLPINFLEGKKPTEYSSGYESAKKWEDAARKVINTGNIIRIEQVSIWKGASQVYDILIVPEKDETGKVNSIISIARDVTEMKKAENILRVSEQRLKYHFENSPLAIVEWDRDFDIIRWSNEAERIFGLTRDEVIGARIDMLNLIYPEDIPLVAKTMKRLTSGKELKVVSQYRNLTKSGEILECIWYNSVLMDEKGEVSSVMSLVEDITLLRQTEKKLMESRESYKELVTNARSMILKFDNEGRFTFVNEFALDFFGYKEEELLGKSVMIVVPEIESTGRDLNEMVNNIKEDPDTFSININENIKKNGEIVWVEWRNKTLFDESGRKTGQISIGIDITERKKAEEALRDSENKLRSVLNAARESIYMFDKDSNVLMANETGLSRLGKTEQHEVIGHHFSEFMNAKLANERKEKLLSVFSNGLPMDYSDVRASRTYHHRFFPVYKDNKVQFVVSYSTDITERKKAEQALLQSEDRFRTIAESLTVMIAITRIKDLKLSFLNEPFEKTFGYKKSDLLGKKLPDIFYYPGDAKFISDIFKVKGFVENMEIKVKKKDGTAFWIMTSLRKISFMNEPSYLTSSIDISENKKAHEELIRLNRTLDARSKSSQAMMHNSDEKEYLDNVCEIIIKDCGHAMVWVGYAQNDKRKTVKPVAHFGFDKGYIDQMNITWDESPNGSGPTGTAIRTGKPSICRNMITDPSFRPWREAAISRGYASSIVLPLKSEGKTFGALTIYSKDPDPFTDAEVDLLTKLADDLAYGIEFIRLTEYEKEAARAIQENEIRLKELVTTKDKFFNIIAHDLKNPFTSLLGASELLYDNIRQMTPENIKDLALILNDSSKSGYAILQNLLDWSRSQTGQLKFNPEKVNLKTIINENIENLQLQVNNKEIKLTSDLNKDLFITADKNMINTVLRNLLSNAVKYTFKNGVIRVIVSQENGEIKLTVKDTGVGMSKKKVDSLFRLENALSLPGTAKEQGTGIGLKLCKEFTEIMGGKIWVDSKVGVGSEFRFSIPES